ncbi:unnamed protein product [Prorocentrum cordatum]|uniref:Subtilisin n=1 Tax=Prorocentrum cordatum TaxID=2364126 RepID=A0ABN9VQQ6_9DINO|nr:unnamed protein product [Polarella glacialis]
MVFPCNEGDFVATLAAGMGYYYDSGVPGGLCRSIDAGKVDLLQHELFTSAWTSTGTGKTFLPLTPSSPGMATLSPTPSPTASPTSAPTPSPTPAPTPSPTPWHTAQSVEYAGWGTSHWYNDPGQNPCNVDEFKATLTDGMGYFYDSAVVGGFCKSINVDNVGLLRAEFGTSSWTDHSTGMTYLPTLESSTTRAPTSAPTPTPTPSPMASPTTVPTPEPTAVPTTVYWVEYAGWGTPDLYTDPPTNPCNVDEFDTLLEDGMGYYYDPNVPGGLCRTIQPENVESLRQLNGTSSWIHDSFGKTYLPPDLPAVPMGPDLVSLAIDARQAPTPAPTEPISQGTGGTTGGVAPTLSPTAASWRWDQYVGWGSVTSYDDPPEYPCNVNGFVASLAPGMGYYYDPAAGTGGLCRSIHADNVEHLRQEYGSELWTGGPNERRSDRSTGTTYLPAAQVRTPPAPGAGVVRPR